MSLCNHSIPLEKTCIQCPRGIASIQNTDLSEILIKEIEKLEIKLKTEQKLKQAYYNEAAKGWIAFRKSERLLKSAREANAKIRKERNKVQEELENKLWDDYPDKWEN